jgi:hypothetical protein
MRHQAAATRTVGLHLVALRSGAMPPIFIQSSFGVGGLCKSVKHSWDERAGVPDSGTLRCGGAQAARLPKLLPRPAAARSTIFFICES